MGGTDEPSNLVELTVEEHAEAHRELYENHGHWQDKIAYQMLSGQITNYEAQQKVRKFANLGNTNFAGHTHSKKYKKKLSLMMKEKRKVNKTMGNHKPHNPNTKSKISESLKGNTNKKGKTGQQKNKFAGERTWMEGDNNPAKRPEVREKLRQAALRRHSKSSV
jgi:hypothetical protein